MTISHTPFLVCLLVGLEDPVLSTLDVINHMVVYFLHHSLHRELRSFSVMYWIYTNFTVLNLKYCKFPELWAKLEELQSQHHHAMLTWSTVYQNFSLRLKEYLGPPYIAGHGIVFHFKGNPYILEIHPSCCQKLAYCLVRCNHCSGLCDIYFDLTPLCILLSCTLRQQQIFLWPVMDC